MSSFHSTPPPYEPCKWSNVYSPTWISLECGHVHRCYPMDHIHIYVYYGNMLLTDIDGRDLGLLTKVRGRLREHTPIHLLVGTSKLLPIVYYEVLYIPIRLINLLLVVRINEVVVQHSRHQWNVISLVFKLRSLIYMDTNYIRILIDIPKSDAPIISYRHEGVGWSMPEYVPHTLIV